MGRFSLASFSQLAIKEGTLLRDLLEALLPGLKTLLSFLRWHIGSVLPYPKDSGNLSILKAQGGDLLPEPDREGFLIGACISAEREGVEE